MGLLSGYRVIESSMLLNGAATGMMLVDLGAEVIKVESPAIGDYLRLPETRHLHLQASKGKRSIALDLKQQAGREVFGRLLQTADVFLTNAVADRNDRLGIGYDQLNALKPDIVYCQNTGFGATGPFREVPAHGQMMDAMAGALPMKMGDDGLVVPSDRYARRTGSLVSGGEGCFIDVSSAHAVVASAWTSVSALLNRPSRRGWWQDEANTLPVARYQAYQTSDGKFVLFCPEEDKFWHAFCDLVGRPDLKPGQRGVELRREIQGVIATRTRDEWLDLAIAHRLPIGPANDGIDEVRADRQLSSRPLFIEGEGDGAPFTYIAQPAVVNRVAAEFPGHAPELGEHGEAILRELGYEAEEIAALREANVIAAPQAGRHIISSIYGDE
jgi:formyl-CoA transferase